VKLSDGFVQTSSIMPQKRNPVALEHARAIASRALGQTHAILLVVHNTPFGDIVDVEDDLQPQVAAMFRDAERTVRLTAAALESAQFDAARLEARAAEGGTTLTELADTLVRNHGLSFRAAHAVAARLAPGSVPPADAGQPARSMARRLSDASKEVTGSALEYSEQALADILSPRHFVAVRRTAGGPAPEETARASSRSRVSLEHDAEWTQAARAAIGAAAVELEKRSARL
jgi:argininosuccinate lyase